MADDNTIRIIAEYIQKNEEALKEFREDIIGLGEDTENTNRKTDENTDSNKKQSSSFTELKSAIGLAQQGYQLLQQGLEATSGKTVAYADDVRKLSLATGQTTEESSRQLQVLSDFGIGLGDIEAASKKMTSNGLAPTLTTLASLSERYNSLGSVQEKNKFLFDELGKSGQKYAEVLSKGKDAILAMNDGVDERLILSQQEVDAARRLQVAQDGVNDSYDAAAMALGNKLIPVQTEFFNGINVLTRGMEIARERNISLGEAMDIAGYEIWQEQEAMIAAGVAADDQAAAEAELTAALEAKSAANQSLLGLMSSISSENKNYIEQQEQVKTKQAEVKAQIDELIAGGWSPLSDKVKDLQTDYDNLGLKSDEIALKHREAMGKIQYDLFMTQLAVGGITDAEFEMAQQAGLMFGVFDQESVDAAKAMQMVTQAVTDGKLQVSEMQSALDLLTSGQYSFEVAMNIVTRGYAGTGAGSSYATNDLKYQQGNSGYSQGTQGWLTVPPGYPNDSYPVMVESGERFAVIPAGASAAPSGGGVGGSNLTVILQIQSPVTILNDQQGKDALLDYVEYGVKTLQERGVI